MIHLHVHSHYSFLDGLPKPKALVARVAAELGMGACALTDHDHIGGLIRFYKAAAEAKIKPILGMEATLGRGHLVLLARDIEGYVNLRALSHRSSLTIADVASHAQGLYALTACVLGHVPEALLAGDGDRARAVLRRFKTIFGSENVGVEVQFTANPHLQINAALLQLAADEHLRAVVTNDVHYLRPEDAEAQNVLMAIRQKGRARVFRHPAPVYFLRSEAEILGAGAPRDTVDNTHVVADLCKVVLTLGKPELPTFDGGDLATRAREGLAARGLASSDVYIRRLEYELEVIRGMGYDGYYLIVADFIAWARGHEIHVGPGRGSGAGSLVAYCLQITNLDPLVHKLVFERFLNPERKSLPDFDTDFTQAGRERVIDYARERYGHVAQIATYMTLGPKAAIKDVARTLGLGFADVNRYTSTIPSALRPKTPREEALHPFDFALEFAPALVARAKGDGQWARVLAIARQLTGCCRQTGRHAGGVVIGRRPIAEYTPMTPEGLAAYDMKDVEDVGLVKFDFLGVKTLDVIDAVARPRSIDVDALTLDDHRVFELMASGSQKKTWGIFQIETPGMTRVCQRLGVSKFEDVVAAVALYRPGPKESGMLDDYVERRAGDKAVEYPHPLLASALADTYGCVVFQEQVLLMARVLAGYSLGAADILRRAVGKKLPAEMHKQRQMFVDGCLATNGIGAEEANRLFDVIDKFSGYGFVRSHAAVYAQVAYQTAWLKIHYPAAFAAALLTSEVDQGQEAVAHYARAARASGIKILGPDINASRAEFVAVDETTIRWGLLAIRGLGEAHLAPLLAGQPYTSFFDVARHVNVKGLQTLIDVGALDALGPREAMTQVAKSATRVRDVGGQTSLIPPSLPPVTRPWSREERWRREFEGLHFHVHDHPLATSGPSAYVPGARTIRGLVVDVDDGPRATKIVIEDGRDYRTVVIFGRNQRLPVLGTIVEFQSGHGKGDDEFVVVDEVDDGDDDG